MHQQKVRTASSELMALVRRSPIRGNDHAQRGVYWLWKSALLLWKMLREIAETAQRSDWIWDVASCILPDIGLTRVGSKVAFVDHVELLRPRDCA